MPVQTPVPAWGGCHPGATVPGPQSAPGAGCFVPCPCPNFISEPQGSKQSPLPACPGHGAPPWWPQGYGREPCCGGCAVPRVSPSCGDITPGHLAGTPAGQPGGGELRPLSLPSTLQRAHAAGFLGRGAHIDQLLAINLSALAHHRVRSGSQRPPVTAGGVLACCGHLATPGDTSVGGRCLHAAPSLGGDGVRRGRGGGGEEGGEREGEGGGGSASSS